MSTNLGFTTKNIGKWAVEVGKGSGSYKTRYTFPSDQPVQAQFYYRSINVHSGFKKRLVNPNGVITLRELS